MDEPQNLRTRLAQRLRTAMRARDTVSTGALRSVSAAFANAEAVEVRDYARTDVGSEHVVGVVGLGATEAARRELSDVELVAIVTAEAEQRESAAQTYVAAGHPGRGERLRHEATIIRALITD